jgi:G6PDH family F420-dependent oxidoreductase
MAKFGYKLMSEAHGPRALVENAVMAEAAGFDFVGISDHFLPWHEAQGHSPFAWSVLGAIAAQTQRVGIATGLTCPLIRYHPAIVAQAAATIALLSDNRFTLAVGAGERLNEHVTGARWPAVGERHEMLREAIEVMRLLWEGESCNHRGRHYRVEQAQLFDLPDRPVEIVVGASGPQSAVLAAEAGDGIMGVEPDRSLLEAWRKAGGKGKACGEIAICYAPSEEEAAALAHDQHRFGLLGWSVLSELATPASFDEATAKLRKEDVAKQIPCGPDAEKHAEAINRFTEAGFDHVAIVGIGPDQKGFCEFFQKRLRPLLKDG